MMKKYFLLCLLSLLFAADLTAQPDNQIIKLPYYGASIRDAVQIKDGWIVAVHVNSDRSPQYYQTSLVRINFNGDVIWEHPFANQGIIHTEQTLFRISGNRVLLISQLFTCPFVAGNRRRWQAGHLW